MMKKFIILGLIFCSVTSYASEIERRGEMPKAKTATFAGGCFWCMEAVFSKLDGVQDVRSGYALGAAVRPVRSGAKASEVQGEATPLGGKVASFGGSEPSNKPPTYEEVSSGGTRYVEAVQVRYNPALLSYRKMLEVYWRNIDPTDSKGQFADRGLQYRPIIFFHSDLQRVQARESKNRLIKRGVFKELITTEIMPYTNFFQAEEAHQDYYKKHPLRYWFYAYQSGRVKFIKDNWKGRPAESVVLQAAVEAAGRAAGSLAAPRAEASSPPSFVRSYTKPSPGDIKKQLSPIQFEVTQKNSTEPPYQNKYWNHNKPGIYVDVVSGEPLFSSLDKYDSRTGWPSFTKPLAPEHIVTVKEKTTLFMKRIEVRSKHGNSHLGHLFNDGPAPLGFRYCINSASLRFIPADQLKEQGYSQYQYLFKSSL